MTRRNHPRQSDRSGITARPPQIRPQHLRKLAVVYARGGRIGLVLTPDGSRLSRNFVDLVALLTEAEQAGVVVFAANPVVHALTPDGVQGRAE